VKKLLMIAIACALLTVYGCEQASDTHDHDHEGSAAKQVDYASIEAQLQKEQQQYAQAWSTQDMDAIGRIWAHDDDITIWDAGVRTRIEGWEGPNGVKNLYQTSFDGAKSIDFKISDVLVKVSKNGTAAVVTYYVENDLVLNDGTKVKMTPRVTVVRELIDGTWKTIHGDASFSIPEINAMK